MRSTAWQAQNTEAKVQEILQEVHDEGPPIGRNFLTVYQLAIKVRERFPDVMADKPVGGKGAKAPRTLANYLSDMLSDHPIPHVECARLSNQNLGDIWFNNHGERIKSPGTRVRPLTMFRWVD
jgi:hypothetical protein